MMKKAICFLMISIMALSVTGCGKKDSFDKMGKKELANLARTNTKTLADKDIRIQELEVLLKGIQEVNGPTAAISTIDDGTGRLTFNSINGKIIFPKPFEYPGSTQAPNTSSINITSTLSISPTNNWITVLDGTTLELNHTNKISGLIKAGYITEMYDREKLQDEVMNEFFADFPPDKITYSKLFLNDQWWGLEGKTETIIEKKPAYIRCGMLGLGEQSFVYMFVYEGKQDAGKDETIVSLLKTMKMLGQSLRIE